MGINSFENHLLLKLQYVSCIKFHTPHTHTRAHYLMSRSIEPAIAHGVLFVPGFICIIKKEGSWIKSAVLPMAKIACL